MFEVETDDRLYMTEVVECLTRMGVVLNADVPAEVARRLAVKYGRMEASPHEVALLISCIAADNQAETGDTGRAEQTLRFLEAGCAALKTPITKGVLEQVGLIRKQIEGTNQIEWGGV